MSAIIILSLQLNISDRSIINSKTNNRYDHSHVSSKQEN